MFNMVSNCFRKNKLVFGDKIKIVTQMIFKPKIRNLQVILDVIVDDPGFKGGKRSLVNKNSGLYN